MFLWRRSQKTHNFVQDAQIYAIKFGEINSSIFDENLVK